MYAESNVWKEQCKKCKSAIPIYFYDVPSQIHTVRMPKSHGTQFGVTVYFYVHACLGSILQPTTPHAKRTKWWEMGVVLVMRLARSTRPTYFRVTCWIVGYFKKICASKAIEVNLCSFWGPSETAIDLKLWPKVLMVFNSSRLKPSTSGFAVEVMEGPAAARYTVGAEVPVEVAPPGCIETSRF